MPLLPATEVGAGAADDVVVPNPPNPEIPVVAAVEVEAGLLAVEVRRLPRRVPPLAAVEVDAAVLGVPRQTK